MSDIYTTTKKMEISPRLPLKGSIDLTYRCNNRCRHCWLWTGTGEGEMTFDEIRSLVDQARSMGCREWAISGGEPMLHPDFVRIFDYITANARTYSINTNGTLITEEIAQLMTRKGAKMVALYGATAAVHDHVTRHPGSFEATMKGFSLLKKAGAGFIVQLIPMKDNFHEFEQMKELAQSLSKHWRIGAPWLYLSAEASAEKNAEIAAQRLSPRDVVDLDLPDLSSLSNQNSDHPQSQPGDDHLFDACIRSRRDFHVDPYGKMSFCCFIKDPSMRYDLRSGSFQDAWDSFIPSLIGKVRGGDEYRTSCGSCEYRQDCRWCPVYSYLEHGRYSAPVEYLCEVAREMRACKERMLQENRRYFSIGGITIQVDSDISFGEDTFNEKFESFRADGPGEDMVSIRHHFSLPDLPEEERGVEKYRKSPWAIYRKGSSWIYTGIPTDGSVSPLHRVAVFSDDHSKGRIYNKDEDSFRKGNLHALTMFPTDQILIARLLADRNGFFLHSSGVIMDGKGLLFVGHSEAGKSTTTRMIAPYAEILCDDRNIVRRFEDGWRVYGTWSHGDVPDVSSSSAPLHAILFLEKADENLIEPMTNKAEVRDRLLACLIRPFMTADWWEKTLDMVELMIQEIPCYLMKFDKTGGIIPEIQKI
ncbi:radical SAM protein [Methanospirillum sp.]